MFEDTIKFMAELILLPVCDNKYYAIANENIVSR